MNLSAKVKDVRDCVIKKVVPVTVAVAGTANALMISAFATGEDASGGLDTTAITTSMQSSLKDLVTKAGVAFAAVIGIGLSIFAGKWLVTTIKNFFTKVAK